MANIRDRSVDLVNLSGGKHHPKCHGECRICTATQAVIDSGMIVIAGAGNEEPNDTNSISCPARCTQAVAVVSYETLCSLDLTPRTNGDLYRTVPYRIQPPGAYAVKNSNFAGKFEPVYIPFCSGRGFSNFHSCAEYREERLSNINVSFSNVP